MCDSPVLRSDDLESLAALCGAVDGARHMFAVGRPVHYPGSTVTSGDSRWRRLFGAGTGGLVQEVNDAAQVPYSRIVRAIEMSPARLPDRDP
jgi:hypothetical protein